mgnify:CR=1 FL=1
MSELLELPGAPLICGDFNCPGSGATVVDDSLADLIDARNLVQRVEVPTHDQGNTLDLIIHLVGGATPLTSMVKPMRALPCPCGAPVAASQELMRPLRRMPQAPAQGPTGATA